jgi:hypothetical protein
MIFPFPLGRAWERLSENVGMREFGMWDFENGEMIGSENGKTENGVGRESREIYH